MTPTNNSHGGDNPSVSVASSTVQPKNRESQRPNRKIVIATISALALVATATGVFIGLNESSAKAPDSDVQKSLDSLVESGFPAAVASVTNSDGTVSNFAAGVNNIDTGEDANPEAYVRVGSNTKTYTATVVLQLVDEGLIELDAPIDDYLPGLIVGENIDPTKITVRHLLQHTSGLPEYTDEIATELFDLRDVYKSPRSLLDAGLSKPALFQPGERWEYSNTGYTALGLLVEEITQRPLGEEITERIVDRLGLEHTYFPQVGEQELRDDYLTGYHSDESGEFVDVSSFDPSWGWAAGQVVATPQDLNLFLRGLLDGKLLKPETLKEMMTTIPVEDLWEGAEYGLGIIRYPLSCGGEAWGHGGDIPGFETRNGVSATDDRAATVAVSSLPWGFGDITDEGPIFERATAVTKVIDIAFCGIDDTEDSNSN